MPLHQQIFAILCIAACGHALARGGLPERVSACSILAAFVLTNILKTPHAHFFHAFEWRIFLLDEVLLAILLAIALISTRHWPLAMVVLHGVSILAHVAKLLDTSILPLVYFGLASQLSWPILLLLIGATERHRHRLHRFGVDFSWVWQLPPAYRAGWLVHERRADRRLERN